MAERPLTDEELIALTQIRVKTVKQAVAKAPRSLKDFLNATST